MSFIEDLLKANGISSARVVTAEDARGLLSDIISNLETRKAEEEEIVELVNERAQDVTPRTAIEFASAALIMSRIEFAKGNGHEECASSAKEASDSWRAISEQLIRVDEHDRLQKYDARLAAEEAEREANSLDIHREVLLAGTSTGELLGELEHRFGADGEQVNAKVDDEIRMMLDRLDSSTLNYRRETGE